MEKELLLELIKKYRPNEQVLNDSIEKLIEKSNGEFTKEEIEKRLNDNGFNGMYLVKKSLYKEYGPDNSAGFYDRNKKIICINIDHYQINQNDAVHELTHALIGGKLGKEIKIDSDYLNFGYGIEEGIATICEGVTNIEKIDDYKTDHYGKQTNIVKQLNVLYNLYSDKKYSNLIVHALKKPEEIIPLIPKIYEDVLNNNIEKVSANKELSRRNAFDLVKGTDQVTEDKDDFELYLSGEFINSIYFTIADKNIRDGKSSDNYKKLFSYDFLTKSIKSNEYKLLLTIFGTDDHDYDMEFLCDQAKKLNEISSQNVIKQESLSNEEKEYKVLKK